MNVLVIGKPSLDVIIPVDNYPQEGTSNNITGKLQLIGGTSIYVACLLAKWGVNVYYTGVVGGDEAGTIIKKKLEAYKINTKYLEINYEKKTAYNYKIIDKSSGINTKLYNDNGILLTKYKYDFVPDIIIMDGTDMNGSVAAVNNFPRAKTILFANKVNEEYYSLSKRCTYVVANVNFAQALTKMNYEFNKPKSLVNLFQKIKDLNKSEYILMLRDKGVMYTADRQVKMIPAMEINVVDDSNSGPAFFGALCYGIINNYNMDICAKIANISGALAINVLGTISSIPDLSKVLTLAGIKEVSTTLPIPQTNGTTNEKNG